MASIPKEVLVKKVMTIHRDDSQPGVAYPAIPVKASNKMDNKSDALLREAERSIGTSFQTVKL